MGERVINAAACLDAAAAADVIVGRRDGIPSRSQRPSTLIDMVLEVRSGRLTAACAVTSPNVELPRLCRSRSGP